MKTGYGERQVDLDMKIMEAKEIQTDKIDDQVIEVVKIVEKIVKVHDPSKTT